MKDKNKAVLPQWNLSVRAFSHYKQLHSRQRCRNNQNSDLHTVKHREHLGLLEVKSHNQWVMSECCAHLT